MKTEPAAPGTMASGHVGFVDVPPCGTPGGQFLTSTTTVTIPAASEAEVIKLAVEGLVTSTSRTKPEPPGVTRAECPWGFTAICGYCPVFRVTCEKRHCPTGPDPGDWPVIASVRGHL